MTDLSLREQIYDKLSEMLIDADLAKVSDTVFADAAADAIIELIKGAVPVWQPIETAPRDGTPILTYSSGCDDRESHLVMWWSDDKAERCGFGWEAYEVGHMLSPDLWLHLEPGASRILAALGVK